MKDKKHLVQLILAIITFTVLLIFVVNHLHIISGFFGMVFSVLLPFLIGCGIAFVLNIPMRGIEQGIFKNEKNRLYRFRRPISMVLTYIAALLFIALVLFVKPRLRIRLKGERASARICKPGEGACTCIYEECSGNIGEDCRH